MRIAEESGPRLEGNDPQALQRISMAIHENPNAILEIDPAFGCTFQNAAAQSRFPDLVVRGSQHPITKAVLVAGERLRSNGGGATFADVSLAGTDYEILVSRSPKSTGFLVFVVDVTELRRAQARREATEEQRRELDRLRAQDRFKTSFINTAAHELNTPLTPIRLQLHLFKTLHKGTLGPEQQQSLDILDRNVDRLTQLVSDVLEVARLESGRLQVRPEIINVVPVLHDSIDSFREPARRVGIDLQQELGGSLPVYADGRRVTQILFNLLGNAIKFTPAGGAVTIETREVRDAVEVRVSDTGIGIDEAQIGRLFQPFVQIHDSTNFTRSGTGLGLFISRGLAVQMGGDLAVESAGPGKGSTFILRLPRSATVPSGSFIPHLTPVPVLQDALARRLRDLI